MKKPDQPPEKKDGDRDGLRATAAVLVRAEEAPAQRRAPTAELSIALPPAPGAPRAAALTAMAEPPLIASPGRPLHSRPSARAPPAALD